MTPEQEKTLVEVSVVLKRVIEDLKIMGDRQDEIRGLPELKDRVDSIYHALYVGDGEQHPPLTQQVSFVEKKATYLAGKMEKLSAARTLGPKERVTLYVALLAAIGSAIKHFSNG